jgi:hypothetical protein
MLISSLFFAMMGALVKFSLKEIPLFEGGFRSLLSALILGAHDFEKKKPLLLEIGPCSSWGAAWRFAAILTNFTPSRKFPWERVDLESELLPFCRLLFPYFSWVRSFLASYF